MNRSHRTRSRCPGAAFTLVELLLAMAVLALMLVLAMRIATHTLALTERGIAGADSRFNGRVSLDFLASELQQAAKPRPGQAGNRPRFLVAPGKPLADLDDSLCHPHTLFFFSPAEGDAAGGNLAFTGYFVRWGGAPGHLEPLLCRSSVPVTTMGAYYQPDQSWFNTAFLNIHAPGTAAENFRGLFSERILAMWVRALDWQGRSITRNAAGAEVGYAFDSEAGYMDGDDRVFHPPAFPPALEVALVVFDEAVAGRLPGNLASPSAKSPVAFDTEIKAFVAGLPDSIRPSITVYRRHISFLTAP